MIYHLRHLYFWKVVKMDKMKNHPTRVSPNQYPQLYLGSYQLPMRPSSALAAVWADIYSRTSISAETRVLDWVYKTGYCDQSIL